MPIFYHNAFSVDYRVGGVWHTAYLPKMLLITVMTACDVLAKHARKWHIDKIIVNDFRGRPAFAYPLT